jgi:carboxymethylenebutenolidase
MWNAFRTDEHDSIHAEVTIVPGGMGDMINAYVARPTGPGPYPGLVLIHHLPGWDEWYREYARRWAAHGFIAVSPNLYYRAGHGTPDDVSARVRAEGGVADDQVVADAQAAMNWLKALPESNDRVGITGTCSGGRHSVLVASRVPEFDAVADCWGGRVVATPEQLTPRQPVAPVDLIGNLRAPLLGIYGNDDQSPSPADVDRFEQALQANGKTYTFHRYDGAGHGFMYWDRPAYRPQQAMDAWGKLVAFFGQNLQG